MQPLDSLSITSQEAVVADIRDPPVAAFDWVRKPQPQWMTGEALDKMQAEYERLSLSDSNGSSGERSSTQDTVCIDVDRPLADIHVDASSSLPVQDADLSARSGVSDSIDEKSQRWQDAALLPEIPSDIGTLDEMLAVHERLRLQHERKEKRQESRNILQTCRDVASLVGMSDLLPTVTDRDRQDKVLRQMNESFVKAKKWSLNGDWKRERSLHYHNDAVLGEHKCKCGVNFWIEPVGQCFQCPDCTTAQEVECKGLMPEERDGRFRMWYQRNLSRAMDTLRSRLDTQEWTLSHTVVDHLSSVDFSPDARLFMMLAGAFFGTARRLSSTDSGRPTAPTPVPQPKAPTQAQQWFDP